MIKKSSFVSHDDMKNTPYFQMYASPIGTLYVGASSKGIKWVKFMGENTHSEQCNIHTSEAVRQLDLYFRRQISSFDLTFDLDGYTDFAVRVWQELTSIPYGTTISYTQLACKLGDVKCIRAAGTANGKNPIPIIIPCHRVIGSDGSLVGFALGLDIKKQLLALENPEKYDFHQLQLSLD